MKKESTVDHAILYERVNRLCKILEGNGSKGLIQDIADFKQTFVDFKIRMYLFVALTISGGIGSAYGIVNIINGILK